MCSCFNVCCMKGCLNACQCSQWRALSLWETGFICFYVFLWTACLLISLVLQPVQGLQDKCSCLAAAYSNIDKWALMLSSRILREFGTVWAQHFCAAFISFCREKRKETIKLLKNWIIGSHENALCDLICFSQRKREMFHVPRLRSLFLHDQHIFLFYMLAYGKSAGKV